MLWFRSGKFSLIFVVLKNLFHIMDPLGSFVIKSGHSNLTAFVMTQIAKLMDFITGKKLRCPLGLTHLCAKTFQNL